MSDGTIREVFLKGNANAEYIASTFTDVLRDLMRATAAKRDPIDGIIRATEKWNILLDLLAHYKEPLSWAKLFEEAVLKLRHDPSDHDNISRAIQEVARARMSPMSNVLVGTVSGLHGPRRKRRSFWIQFKPSKCGGGRSDRGVLTLRPVDDAAIYFEEASF